MKGSAEIPHDIIRRYDEFIPEPVPALSSETSAAARDRWYGMVEDYLSRYMTCESDKLPALAGLATNFQRETLTDGTYLAGLWKEHFPGCLLWKVRRRDTSPARCITLRHSNHEVR